MNYFHISETNCKVELKDELAYTINMLVESTGMSLRKLSEALVSTSLSTLSNIRNYKLETITIERLVKLIYHLELFQNGHHISIRVDIVHSEKLVKFILE